MLGVEAGALRGPARGRAERCVLCIWPARGPQVPSSAGAELLKAETDCAVLLREHSSGLVDISKLLTFLTAFFI